MHNCRADDNCFIIIICMGPEECRGAICSVFFLSLRSAASNNDNNCLAMKVCDNIITFVSLDTFVHRRLVIIITVYGFYLYLLFLYVYILFFLPSPSTYHIVYSENERAFKRGFC